MLNYIVNDPMTNVFVPVELPNMDSSGPTFNIFGYIGYPKNNFTLEYQAACCHYNLVKSLDLLNKIFNTKFTKWATTKNLIVQPRAGKQLNAYYNRKSLRFFYAEDPVTKKTVYTSNSMDIVSHEIGHAILDILRPDFFHVQAFEIWAFHEAFGDIHSVIQTLQHDAVIDFVLNETNNDLRKNNIVSKIAEEMGMAIYNVTKGKMGNNVCFLRNLINDFKYQNPRSLPSVSYDYELSAESHNFSRIFSGCWYDILVEFFEFFKKEFPPKLALIKARHILTEYTYKAIKIVPNTIDFFDAIAKSMLIIDKTNNYQFNEIMNKCFLNRNILKENFKPLLTLDFNCLLSLKEKKDIVYDTTEVKSITNKNVGSIYLPNHMMNVSIATDVMYEFDKYGRCINVIASSIDEIIDHTNNCVSMLKNLNMIRPDKNTPFEITNNGDLIRTHFSCGCCSFSKNATDPNASEYGKPYKPNNQVGCGCSGKVTKPKCVTLEKKRTGSCVTVSKIPCSKLKKSKCGCNQSEISESNTTTITSNLIRNNFY